MKKKEAMEMFTQDQRDSAVKKIVFLLRPIGDAQDKFWFAISDEDQLFIENFIKAADACEDNTPADKTYNRVVNHLINIHREIRMMLARLADSHQATRGVMHEEIRNFLDIKLQ